MGTLLDRSYSCEFGLGLVSLLAGQGAHGWKWTLLPQRPHTLPALPLTDHHLRMGVLQWRQTRWSSGRVRGLEGLAPPVTSGFLWARGGSLGPFLWCDEGLSGFDHVLRSIFVSIVLGSRCL